MTNLLITFYIQITQSLQGQLEINVSTKLALLLLFLHMQDTKIRKHMYSYMYRLNTKDINIQFTIHIYI